MIEDSIFRAYDIRGNTEKNLNSQVSFNVGYHFARMSFTPSNNRIVVGYDGRNSSPWLYESLIAGLAKAGAEITSIGLATTPLLYFADYKLSPAASIMITGSHNPKQDNGFKLLAGGVSFYGEKISALHALINSDIQKYVPGTNIPKRFYNVNVRPFYIERILKNIHINPDLKIIWDTGNGSAGAVLAQILAKLPNKNYLINAEVDGSFPNHHPDPTVPENLMQLISVVKEVGADFGFAFDGDADRIGLVTKDGKIIYGDQLICIFAKEILARKPGSSIIGDVKCSKVLFDYISSLGGRPIMWKTGHALIKTKMKESEAEIAGEMSGHIFFSDGYLGFDDGIYAALRLTDIISRSNETLEEMLGHIPVAINTPEIRIAVDDDKKFLIVEHLKNRLVQENINFSDIDGLRVDKERGWWLLRPSNTQGALIGRCEANSLEELKLIIDELNNYIRDYNISIPDEY
ncbi:MAG: phosphomannomutase/phosphoglucomutase [Rickettsiaceae bacterium]|nr:phosphomannomutase/phosphoglucomutase [Rickettsiaceae bacterium]